MVLRLVGEGLANGMQSAVQSMVIALPKIVAAIIILFIGYVVGKVIGSGIRKLLEKADLGKKVDKSKGIHGILKVFNTSFEGLIGTFVSVFFYVVFILAAIDILEIDMLSNFVSQVLIYLPNLIAGILVLIVGLVAVEWIVEFIDNAIKEYKIGNDKVISAIFRVILTLVVIIITLDQWKINTAIIYTFVQPLAWGIAAAIAISFGWGFKDTVSDWAKKQSFASKKKK